VDRHSFDADQDPFHFDADPNPDPASDPTFHFDADPNPDPDPTTKNTRLENQNFL
jgi:hypothetical protein